MKDFLVINNILIPDMEKDSLTIYEQPLDQSLRMISGRMVIEERGRIWVIKANFEDIDTQLLQELTASLKSNWIHNIAFLPPDGGKNVISSRFVLTQQPTPALRSWQDEYPAWASLSYTFEEEEPHDLQAAG